MNGLLLDGIYDYEAGINRAFIPSGGIRLVFRPGYGFLYGYKA